MGGNRPARTSVPDTLLVAAALFLGGSVLAGLLGRDDLRLMDRARLDPKRPAPDAEPRHPRVRGHGFGGCLRG